jgi:hypothetical protein
MKFFNLFKSNNHSTSNSTSDSKSISSSDSKSDSSDSKSDSTSYPIFYNNINIQQQQQHKQQKKQQKQLLDNYCNYLENQILLLEHNIKIPTNNQITHSNKQKLEALVLEYKNIKLS